VSGMLQYLRQLLKSLYNDHESSKVKPR